jgi:hypothetical protein
VARKLESWIESFVEHTDNLESPTLFRKWAGIFTVAAAMEMKCGMVSAGSLLYPNMYVFIIGHPGVGKTRIIRAAKRFMGELPEFHFAPTSVTGASLVDKLAASKRFIPRLPDPPLEYYNTVITAEEFGALMAEYSNQMVSLLSHFYDPDPYEEERRGRPENKVKISRGQVNMITATTPSSLLSTMPEFAWDQGFTSRIIMVNSDERIIGDDFAEKEVRPSDDLVHDIKMIGALNGEFKVTLDFRNAVNDWRALGEPPIVNHPKLLHYKTRRRVHLYKLAMVSCADRSDVLLLTKDDFNRAMGWLLEAEASMPDIFTAGSNGTDARATDEIVHFIHAMDKGQGIPEHMIINFARSRVPMHSILRVIEIMVASGQIRNKGIDKFNQRWFTAVRH